MIFNRLTKSASSDAASTVTINPITPNEATEVIEAELASKFPGGVGKPSVTTALTHEQLLAYQNETDQLPAIKYAAQSSDDLENDISEIGAEAASSADNVTLDTTVLEIHEAQLSAYENERSNGISQLIGQSQPQVGAYGLAGCPLSTGGQNSVD